MGVDGDGLHSTNYLVESFLILTIGADLRLSTNDIFAHSDKVKSMSIKMKIFGLQNDKLV